MIQTKNKKQKRERKKEKRKPGRNQVSQRDFSGSLRALKHLQKMSFFLPVDGSSKL